MDRKAVLQKYFDKIEELRNEGDFKGAYKLCIQILEADPENSKAISLTKKIEKDIQAANTENIEENIKRLEPLWETERYEELVEKYHQIYELAPNYEPLEKLIAKAERKLREKIENNKRNFVANFQNELDKFFQEGKYEEMVLKSTQTAAAYPSNMQIKQIGEEMRIKVVQEKLVHEKPLLESQNYTEILKFLEHLKGIEPTFTKTQKLIEKYKKKGLSNLTEDQREFVYRGVSHAKTLIQLKKYHEAAQAAEEILEIDPGNKEAKKIYKIGERKSKKQIQKEVIENIKKDYESLKNEYQQNKEAFVKL